MPFAISIDFTTPYALFGLFAVAIPLLLAFFLRPRPVPVRWATMRILEKAAKKMQTRIRLHDFLRLGLRMLLIGSAALAIAGPFVLHRSNVDFAKFNSESELKILLLDGSDTGRKRIEDEFPYSRDDIPAAYISAALNGPGMKIDRINLGVAEPEEFKPGNYDIVILADIARLTSEELSEIELFLRDGGGLLVFFGSRSDPEGWNDGFLSDFFENVRLGPVRKNENPGRLDPHSYKSDLLQAFKGYPNSGLLDLPLRYYHPIECDKTAAVLSLPNGEPLIVDPGKQLRFAHGENADSRVILVAFAPEMSMGAVPLWPSFVPLMQELVQGLSPERRALKAASNIPFPLAPWFVLLALAAFGAEIVFFRQKKDI